MRRREVPHRIAVYTAAWAVVGGAFLWSINALADGVERPARQAALEDPPDYPELLGGEHEPAPPAETQLAVAKPQPAHEQEDCITFERALVLIGKIENQTVEDVDAFIRDLQRDLGDEEWCGGVRETIKIAFIPDPVQEADIPDPERVDLRDPRDPGIGRPPGGGGGPGYTSAGRI
jgi:hypothetical protein